MSATIFQVFRLENKQTRKCIPEMRHFIKYSRYVCKAVLVVFHTVSPYMCMFMRHISFFGFGQTAGATMETPVIRVMFYEIPPTLLRGKWK